MTEEDKIVEAYITEMYAVNEADKLSGKVISTKKLEAIVKKIPTEKAMNTLTSKVVDLIDNHIDWRATHGDSSSALAKLDKQMRIIQVASFRLRNVLEAVIEDIEEFEQDRFFD